MTLRTGKRPIATRASKQSARQLARRLPIMALRPLAYYWRVSAADQPELSLERMNRLQEPEALHMIGERDLSSGTAPLSGSHASGGRAIGQGSPVH